MTEKKKVARLSVISNTTLIILKLLAGFLSNSVSIISEAIHSSLDLIAALITFFSVKVSDNPADKEHPYGHGKIENVSGVIEAILIFIAAVWIIYEAIKKLIEPEVPESLLLGICIMFISGVINFFVSKKLYYVAKKTESVALEADALHLKTDIYTSLGVGVGLVLIWVTKITWLDPVIAMLVALFILYEAFRLLKKAFLPLLDTSMSDNDIQHIKNILDKMDIKYHDLKTRTAGNYKYLDFHMNVNPGDNIDNIHNLCDNIENQLNKEFKNLNINIHPEPKRDE
ncbi:MAG: cation transporter [Bacteroidia bacterium]|nr:cation transporter [Bacteroidia bacterium]